MLSLRRTLLSVVLGGALVGGLAACSFEAQSGIPNSSRLVAEGQGALSYRAPYDGKVYVYDSDNHTLLYSGDIRQDQLISVSPRDNRITIGDNVVRERGVNTGHAVKVYFDQRPVR